MDAHLPRLERGEAVTITELRERVSALRLDPTDDTDANNAMLDVMVEVCVAAKAYSDHKWPTGQPNSRTVTFSMQLPELQERLVAAVARLDGGK